MERTTVPCGHLLGMEVPLRGAHFSQRKEQDRSDRSGMETRTGPRDTVQWPLGKGRWLSWSLSFLLCETGVTVSISQDQVSTSLRIK